MSPLAAIRQTASRLAETVRSGRVRRFAVFALPAAAVIGLFFATPLPAAAAGFGEEVGSAVGDLVLQIIGWICMTIIELLGKLILVIVPVLIGLASYNDFVKATVVGSGWVIVRDIVNMFFVVILLIMAFGTMLGVDEYSISGRASLARVVIMAIVINFSRTLCGLMIDFAQVVMMTFVSGFKEAAGGNFMEALKINEVLQTASQPGAANMTGIIITYLLAIIMTGIALFVILTMTMSLAFRIINLWLLVIISPLAFFARAVPGGKAGKFYSDWWSKFTNTVLYGPFLAFFLWLSLVTIQTGNLQGTETVIETGEAFGDSIGAVFNSRSVVQFIISISLLLGGFLMSQELAAAGGMAGGKAMQTLKGIGQSYLKAGRMVGKAGKFAAEYAPTWKKDEVTGRRVTLGALAGAWTQKVKDSKYVRPLTKEGRELRTLEQTAAAARTTGQEQKAVELQQKAEAIRTADMKRRMKPDDIVNTYKNKKAPVADRRAAAMALAELGHKSVMFKGEEIGKTIDEDFGGDVAFEKKFRGALRSAGDTTAMRGAQWREVQRMPEKERNDFIRQGKLDVKELTPEQETALAPIMASAPFAVATKYEKAAKDNQMAGAYLDGLKNAVPTIGKQIAEAKRTGASQETINGLEQRLKDISGSILRVDLPREAMKNAFGIGTGEAGKFGFAQKDAAGNLQYENADQSQKNFEGAFAYNSAAIVHGMKKENLVGADGKMTDVGRAIAEKLDMKMLANAAKNASNAQEAAGAQAVIDMFMKFGTDAQKNHIQKGMAFQDYDTGKGGREKPLVENVERFGGGPRMEEAPAAKGAPAASKVEVEVKVEAAPAGGAAVTEADINAMTAELQKIEQQITEARRTGASRETISGLEQRLEEKTRARDAARRAGKA